jgi:hypothetical protein
VLIVGTGTSGIDISRDLAPHVPKIYMVGKNEIEGPPGYQQMRKMQRYLLPENGEQIPEIRRFYPPEGANTLEDAKIELTDGRIISGVGSIIFATG